MLLYRSCYQKKSYKSLWYKYQPAWLKIVPSISWQFENRSCVAVTVLNTKHGIAYSKFICALSSNTKVLTLCSILERPEIPHLTSIALWALEAASSQAAIWCGATTADDLQLFFCTVGSVQQFLDELLQAHLGVGFTCCRLLKELVNLGDLPEGRGRTEALVGHSSYSRRHTTSSLNRAVFLCLYNLHKLSLIRVQTSDLLFFPWGRKIQEVDL